MGRLYGLVKPLYFPAHWFEAPWLPLFDRLVYGLFFIPTAILFLFLILPRSRPGRSSDTPPPRILWRNPEHSRLRGCLIGLLTGLFFFGLVFIYTAWSDSGGESPKVSEFRQLMKQNPAGIFFYLLSGGILTPVLEEIYYRGIFQSYVSELLQTWRLALVIQAIWFGLAHSPAVLPYLTLLGLVFGILYWRYGLYSSILAHVVYNTLIILGST